MKNIIVIGAGPAGASAALYAKARGKDVLVFEKDKVGGLIANVSKVSHYVSVKEDISGPEFAETIKNQLDYSNIEVKYERVLSVEKNDEGFVVETNNGEYSCKKLICATGSTLKELNVKSNGSDFKHWPFGKEDELKDKTVVMNGGSDGACKEALFISKFAKVVHIIQDQETLLCIDEFKTQILNASNIVVHTGSMLEDAEVEDGKIVSVSTNKESISDPSGIEVYVQIGQFGNSELFEKLAKIENSFVQSDIKSDVEGLYFAGDVRVKAVKQIATAVADGCLAGIEACK